MTPEVMKARTKAFALAVVKLVGGLPQSETARVIGRQLLRSGTSVGGNHRAACRAKSTADFLNKMSVVEEECDESIYWMELLIDAGLTPPSQVKELSREANEIVAIVVSSIKRTRERTGMRRT